MGLNDVLKQISENQKAAGNPAAGIYKSTSSGSDKIKEYFVNSMRLKSIDFDTLGGDLQSAVDEAKSYLEGGWADAATGVERTKKISSLISRLGSVKQYYTANADQFEGDVSESIAEIDRTLGALTELSGYISEAGEIYSNFRNGEEYEKAKAYYQSGQNFGGYTGGDMQDVRNNILLNKIAGTTGTVSVTTRNGKTFTYDMDDADAHYDYLSRNMNITGANDYITWAKQQPDFEENTDPVIDPHHNGVLPPRDEHQLDQMQLWEYMTTDERKTYYYLYNTEGKNTAENFYKMVAKALPERRYTETVNKSAAFAKEHPWLATIHAVGSNILTSFPTFIENTADMIRGDGFDQYSQFNSIGAGNDVIFQIVPKDLAKKYGWDENVTSLIYSTGVSIAQSVGTTLLFGGYSGIPAAKWMSRIAIGMQAANSTMRNMAAQGAEDWQIYALGLISGAAEAAMEMIPLENLIKIGKEGGKAGLKATLKNILKQTGTEFLEEAGTEVINILADAIIRKGDSDAANSTIWDIIGDIVMAGAGGALSGGIMGLAFSIYGGTVGSAQYRQVGKFIVDNGAANTLIEQGLKLGQGSEAYEIAELLKRRMTNNREGKLNATSYADVGRLYALETVAVREQYMQATENKLSVKLEAAGVKSSKAEGLSKALAKAISGEQMTRAETKAIGKSAQAMQILEQSRAMLDPARVAFNPIQKSTTYGIADGAMVITRLGDSNMYRVDLLPSANAERVASTGEIGDGAVRTLESQSVRQVEQMVKKAAEGAGIADISSGFGEQLSSKAAVAETLLSAELSGVNENVAGIAAGIAEAMGGDLRIVFDPELSKTGDTGIYRKNYDGTREAQIAPTLGGVVSSLAHELFHDIEDTAAGKAFIAAAVEYAKTLPAKNPDNGANRYEEVKHLYQTRKGVSDKAELETEVGAKIAGDILASEDALMAVLEHMKPQQKASLWQRLKRALSSLRDKLKGKKNAKPAETQLNVLERLYKQAFAQRVIQDAVENPRVGDPNAVSEQKGKKTPTEGESSANDRQVTGKLNSDQKEKTPEREADVAAQNAQKAVFGSEKVEDDTSGRGDSFGVKACLSEADNIGQKSIAYNERHSKVNAAVLKVGVEVMMEMAETMKPYLEEEGILPPDTNRNNGKTLFKNGSYGRTAENTTRCIRTLTYDDFKDRVAENVGKPLTVAESLLVSQKIYDIATDPQCIYCYVAADRKSYDEYLGEYHAAMDKYIKALKDGGNRDELYSEYLDGRKDTKAQQKRFAAWEKLARSGGKYITAADLATSAKRNAIIDRGGALAEQVKDAQRYAQSASWAKKVEEYRAYNGEILKLTQQLVDTLNSEYGLRMYSFSDYTPAFIVENMQMIIDAACRGLKSLAYTKDTDYAKIFARTGQAINISCFAKWQDGVYVEDNRQGADWAEAKKLREQYPNVGVVMVAVTEPMVEWAVRQDWIDVVIPYHIVKTGTKIANEYQWRNFTADSADKAGNRVANIYPTEHNNDFATYKRLIEERGLTPRFNEYYERVAKGELTPEQYMKLVNEVRLPASELSAVIPDFDLDAARESFGVDAEGNVIKGGFVDKGGYMGSWYRDGIDVEQEAMQVADDIRAGKSSLDVEYGMNSRAKLRQAQKYGVIKADVAEDDAAYMAAVKRGDMETAQRMVDEAAREAGYDTTGYHGTHAYGFTTVNGSLWLARDKEVAKTYGPYFGVRDWDATVPYDADGVYSFRYRLGNNLLIDADGSDWGALPVSADEYPGVYVDEETGDITTNAMAEWAEKNGYDSITFENVDDGGFTTVDVVFKPKSNVKSANPITYDDNGNVIPLSKRFNMKDPDIRYEIAEDEIPNSSREYAQMKREEEKRAASEKRKPTATYKAYNTSHMIEVLRGASKVITADAINEITGKNLAYVRTDRDSVTSLARKLSEEFNLAQENGADEKKIRAIADAIADEVINDTYADDVDVIDKLTKDKDITYRTLNILQHGIGRMLLSDDDINGIYNQNKNKDARRIVSRWRAAKNMRKTYLPSQIANELAAESVTLDIAEDAWNESNILLALDKLYINAKAAYEEAVRKQIGTAEEYTELKQKISDQVFEAFREGEADVRVAKAQAAAKVIVDVTRAKELARRKRETGRLSGDDWKKLVSAISEIVTGYNVSVPGSREMSHLRISDASSYNISVPAVRAFAKAYVGFVSTQAHELHEMLTDTEGSESAYEKYAKAKNDGENQVLESIDPRIARGIYAIAEGDEGTALTADELEALHAGLRNLLALDNRYNRVHMDGRWENTDKYAKQGIADSESEYGSDGKKQIGVGWVKQVEDPYDVASSVGGHNRDSVLAKAVRVIQHAATEAQYKEMQYMKEVEDFFDSHKAFRKKYRDQRIEFKTVRKNPVTGQQVEGSVTMTLGEFLGLYMTSKRKQAFISLAMSDIVFDKMPGVRDHEQRLAGLKMQYEGLTEVQIEAAMRGMGNALIAEIGAQYEKIADDDIRAFVAAVERFFNEVSTREKTETDLLLYGYTNVLGGYYYPLERDKNAFDVNLIGNDRIIGNMIGVGNFSFNKATVERASKPLMIRDTMTVMRRHAHQLATYTTMTVPLQNINRIYNCKVNDTTLKDFIHNNVWAGFGKYLRNYLLDVQGSRRADADFEELRSILSTVKSNYAKSVLAMNPKSILTQFSTVIAMQGQVSYSSWAKGLAMAAFLQRTEGEDGKILARLAEMDKYSHGAAVRNDSNEIYLATGAVGKLGNVTDKLMIGQLVTDRLTCFAMYSMCQYEVQRTQGLAVGTAENKAAAGKMLDEMILNLQDTSAAATKTALARSTSEFISNFAMFKSAELKQFSRIAYALADMRAHGVTRARVGAFSKELGAFLGSKVYAAVIALAWAAFRGRWEEDDEGKDRGFIEMLTSELFMDMVGFVPVFGSLAENVMTGFGLELPSESVVNDLITAIRSTGGIISDIADGGSFEFKKAVNLLSSAGQALGLPVRNLANVVEGAFNMAGLADSRIKYSYDKFMSGGSATVNDLREAIDAGDERLAETVADMLMVDRVGSSVGSEAAGEIVSLYASGETGVLPSKIGNKITVSINDESHEIELTAADQRELRAEYGKATGAVRRMVSTSAYSRLTTSERAVAVRDMNRLYMDRAKAKLYGADMTTAVAMTCLMSEGKYICAYAHIKAIKADKTVKNKATQIKRWLRSQGLSVAEQRAILYASGYRSEENLAAVKRLLRSASLSAKEKAAVRAALSIE